MAINTAKTEHPIGLWIAAPLLAFCVYLMAAMSAGDDAPTATSCPGQTLYAAILNDDLPALQRAWPGAADPSSSIALSLAVTTGHVRTVAWLLAQGADPDSRTLTLKTPLMCAAASPNGAAIAQMLMDAGADPNLTDENGTTALQSALVAQDAAVARLLE